jgi:hypothetical protein
MFPGIERGPRMVRRGAAAAAVALACAVLLSSCSIVSDVVHPDQSRKQADAQIQHIADAVKHHDPAALKKLFSPVARAKATHLDSELRYFLSVFPSGRVTWKGQYEGPGGTGLSKSSKEVVETEAYYELKANGKEYELFFADVTADSFQPHHVGIYALGVARDNAAGAAELTPSGGYTPFHNWIDMFGVDNLGDTIGDPGVFVRQK